MAAFNYMGDVPSSVGNVEWSVNTTPPTGYVRALGQGYYTEALKAAGAIKPGAGKFLAPGDTGNISALDGSGWNTPNYKYTLAYGRRGVGILGQGNPAASLRGPEHTFTGGNYLSSIDFSNYVIGISFCNDRFIACGSDGADTPTIKEILVTDTEWTVVSFKGGYTAASTTSYTTPNYRPYSIVYGAGLYVGIGSSTGVVTSTGSFNTWTLRTLTGRTGSLVRLFFSNDLFVLCTTTECFTSPDGITWTRVTRTLAGWSTITDFAADELGNYLITDGTRLAWSTDLATWTTITVPYSMSQLKILGTSGTFIIGGAGSTTTLAITADLGANWTSLYNDGINSTQNSYAVEYLATDGGNLVTYRRTKVGTASYEHWFELGTKLPFAHPLTFNGTTYYPYVKVS